jgi:hypothetical protein
MIHFSGFVYQTAEQDKNNGVNGEKKQRKRKI